MNLIVKLLLPYFPNTNFLKKQWWHRLAKVIAIITSILLNSIALFLIILNLFGTTGSSSSSFLSCFITPKLTVEQYGKQLKENHVTGGIKAEDFIPPKPLPTPHSGFYPSNFYLTNYESFSDLKAGNVRLKNNPEDNDKIIGYNCFDKFTPFFLFLAFVPILLGLFSINLLYRLFLYVTLNNEWRK